MAIETTQLPQVQQHATWESWAEALLVALQIQQEATVNTVNAVETTANAEGEAAVDPILAAIQLGMS